MSNEPIDYDLALAELGQAEQPWPLPADGLLPFKRIALSLGIGPSPLFFAGVEGARGTITSQIAVEMSIQAVQEESCRYYEALSLNETSPDAAAATAIIRAALKEANRRVYEYAHRMAAGGRIAATGFVACLAERRFSIARAGNAAGFIWRNNALAPLYEPAAGQSDAGVLDRFIGANSQILVDLASLDVASGDVLVIVSHSRAEDLDRRIRGIFERTTDVRLIAAEAAAAAAGDPDAASLASHRGARHSILAVVVRIGPPCIRLTEVITEG